MKKLVLSIMALLTLFSLQSVANANSGEELIVSFEQLEFTVNDYVYDNIGVSYSNNGNIEVATVTDLDTGEIVETIELIPNMLLRNSFRSVVTDSHSHTLRRTFTKNRTTFQLDIHVEIYNKGSFRQINSIQGNYLGIIDAVTQTYIEGQTVSVWSSSGFPTTRINYAVSGTLVGVLNNSLTTTVGAQLKVAGFSFSHTIGNNSYYRTPLNENGTISLY